jgi:hypothetical protein
MINRVELNLRIKELEGENQGMRIRLAVADSEKTAGEKRERDLERRLAESQLASVFGMKK